MQRETTSFYKLVKTDKPYAAYEIANQVKEKVSVIGENYVIVQGDSDKTVNNIVVGTGAITQYRDMFALNPDVIIATDDGTNYWQHGLLAKDLKIPVILVSHFISELPGILKMKEYFDAYCKDIEVIYVGTPFPMYTI